jgi:serine/threonine-protein kinase
VSDPDEASGQAPTLEGTLVAGRYQVEKLLGMGAMGAVYKARHVHMQKAVALKVLHRETSENSEVVSRFEREAIAAGRIAHPNVAGATDFGRLDDGSFYLVLEYVAGRSLGVLIAEQGRLPLARALGIAEQIASALAAAHRADIVHRDLKPENVMLLDVDAATVSSTVLPTLRPGSATGADVVKVLDFGLAKLQQKDTDDTQLTMAGAVYGTPQYMAPEQAAGQEVDHRADLYAVGLMLYEMLVGKPPFQSEQMMPLLLKHMTEPPPPLPSEVPRGVRRIVGRLLEKQPADRYESADELLLELGEASRVEATPEAARTLSLPARLPTLPEVAAGARRASRGAVQAGRWAARVSRPLGRALRRPVTVRGRRVPLGVLLALPLVLGLLLLLVTRRDEAETPAAGAPVMAQRVVDGEVRQRSTVEPELRKVLDAAEQGSDSALYALEQRPDDARSVDEWLALAQARLMRKQVDEALGAFARAIEADSTAAEHRALLGALRFLADQEAYAAPILEFAAGKLGDTAPDFLFHVWSKTSAKTTATALAAELLERRDVQARIGPALRVALDLRKAKSCADFAGLMPRVEEHGDDRSLPVVRKLLGKTKCKDAEDPECFACLAEGGQLEAAYGQAALRKGPQFPLLRRWQWKS